MKTLRFLLLTQLTFVILAGCATTVPVSEISTKETVFARELADTQLMTIAPKAVVKAFTINDPVVNVLVTVKWDANKPRAGVHNIRWEWYTGSELISKVNARFNFYTTPFTLLGTIPTMMLGVGKHSVKLFIRDQEFANASFLVTES